MWIYNFNTKTVASWCSLIFMFWGRVVGRSRIGGGSQASLQDVGWTNSKGILQGLWKKIHNDDAERKINITYYKWRSNRESVRRGKEAIWFTWQTCYIETYGTLSLIYLNKRSHDGAEIKTKMKYKVIKLEGVISACKQFQKRRAFYYISPCCVAKGSLNESPDVYIFCFMSRFIHFFKQKKIIFHQNIFCQLICNSRVGSDSRSITRFPTIDARVYKFRRTAPRRTLWTLLALAQKTKCCSTAATTTGSKKKKQMRCRIMA